MSAEIIAIELLNEKLNEIDLLIAWNVEGSEKLDEYLRQSDALKIVLKLLAKQ